MRKRLFHVAISAMILFTTLPATGAAGGGGAAPETTALETVLTDVLGFDADQAQMFGESLNDVGADFDDFGWGGDASVPATLTDDDIPWSTPTGVGFNFITFQDSELPDFETPMDGMVMGTTEGGIQQSGTYMVAAATMGDDIPLSSAISGIRGDTQLFKQFDFAFRILELAAWVGFASQFPDDTWIAASFVMSLAYGVSPWQLAFYMFSDDGQQVLPMDLPGFFIIYGNVLMVAVLATAIFDGPIDPYTLGLRLAIDIKSSLSQPDDSRVVRSPSGAPTSESFFDNTSTNYVPGLDGRFDPYRGYALRGPDDRLWVYGQPRQPWGTMPPTGIFSGYFQAGYFGDSSNGASDYGYVGWQTHKGTPEFFTSSPDGPLVGGGGYIQTNGSVMFETPWLVGDEPWTIFIDGGTQPEEGGQFKYNQIAITVDPETIETVDDPMTYHDTQPVYDLVTGEQLEVVTTTTTLPASTSESTQPGSTTETTQATTTTTTTTTTERGGGESCWWCWGIVFLFLAVLLSILWIWLKTYEWWTCWIPWAIVIFAWIPFILAGMWWWRPSWWWVPLLAWFPLVAGYWWYWARHRSWWQPWHVYVVGGYLVALAAGMLLVGAPEWGLLFPLFWVPWVGFYLWFRGARQPWFQPWMWLFFGGYVAWVFIWVVALTPWWAWWLPVLFSTVTFWWFTTHGYSWGELRGPKWCWITPFALLPFLAWWVPLWGPWWCVVIAFIATASLVCAIVNHVWEKEWWTCWLLWVFLLWVGIPFLLAGLWFFQPNWWSWPLLGWFVVIPYLAWWWGQHRSWWQPWYWYIVGGYLGVAAVLMYVVGSPTWGLLFPVFWLAPVAFYLWYRPMRRPWFQPWMWGLFGAYIAWVFIWVIWLTPFWGWWFPVFFLPFFGWWGMNQGYEQDVLVDKSVALIPLGLLPWMSYMVAIYCIPEYYWF